MDILRIRDSLYFKDGNKAVGSPLI